MANRIITAVLTGLAVGALMGAGVVQYATLTADILLARTDLHYRSARYNSLQNEDSALLRNDGMTGIRSAEPAPARGAAPAQLPRSGCMRIDDGAARATCLEQLINAIIDTNK